MLTVGVLLALMPLLFFKYFNFINESIESALSMAGLSFHLTGLNWAIPIGISFYTFQALSYSIDVYLKKLPATHDIVEFFGRR